MSPGPQLPHNVPSAATEWVKKRGLYYPFSAPSYTADGTELPRSVLDFEIKGEVVSAFLKTNALSHSLTLKVSQEAIENIKHKVKYGPPHDQADFRWPVEESAIKLVGKVQYPPREIDQNQNTSSRDFRVAHFNPPLLHDGEHSTHPRKKEAPL